MSDQSKVRYYQGFVNAGVCVIHVGYTRATSSTCDHNENENY